MLQNLLLALSLTGCIGVSSLNDYHDHNTNTNNDISNVFRANSPTTMEISTLSQLPLIYSSNYTTTTLVEGYTIQYADCLFNINDNKLNGTNFHYNINKNNSFFSSIDLTRYQYLVNGNGEGLEIYLIPILRVFNDNNNFSLFVGMTNTNSSEVYLLPYLSRNMSLVNYYMYCNVSIYSNGPGAQFGSFDFVFDTYTSLSYGNLRKIVFPYPNYTIDYNVNFDFTFAYTSEYLTSLEQIAYTNGYQEATLLYSDYSLINLFWSIADTPVLMLKSLFLSDFTFMGFTFFGLLTGVLTLVLVTWIIRKLL